MPNVKGNRMMRVNSRIENSYVLSGICALSSIVIGLAVVGNVDSVIWVAERVINLLDTPESVIVSLIVSTILFSEIQDCLHFRRKKNGIEVM